jgi:hypothetical protein
MVAVAIGACQLPIDENRNPSFQSSGTQFVFRDKPGDRSFDERGFFGREEQVAFPRISRIGPIGVAGTPWEIVAQRLCIRRAEDKSCACRSAQNAPAR